MHTRFLTKTVSKMGGKVTDFKVRRVNNKTRMSLVGMDGGYARVRASIPACVPMPQCTCAPVSVPTCVRHYNDNRTINNISPLRIYVAKTEFGVEDEEILSAIYFHTVGKLNMTTFEKIIFLADKIEPNTRDKDWRERIYKILDEENGLDKALMACYDYTIKSLVDRHLKICLTTIKIYNELLDNIKA